MSDKYTLDILGLLNLHLALILFPCLIFGQTEKVVLINQIDVKFSNNLVVIQYDVIGGKRTALYNVQCDVYKDGQKLKASALSGDVGNGIMAGKGLSIQWDQLADGHVLNDDITITIRAYPQQQLQPGKAIVKSLFVPGLGDYQLRPKKHYFVYSLLTLGAAGTGGYYFWQSNQTYNSYKGALEIPSNDRLFRQANTERYISYALLGAAVIGWAADLIALKVRANKLKRKAQYNNGGYYLPPDANTRPIVGNSPLLHLDTRSEYDLAIAEGNDLLEKNRLSEAKEIFQKAKTLKPSELEPEVKLGIIEEKLAALAAIQANYDKLVVDADRLLQAGNLIAAKQTFTDADALNVKDRSRSRNGLSAVAKEEKKIADEESYKLHIADGDKAMLSREYKEAKRAYDKALRLFPGRQTANRKYEEADIALQKEVSAEYKRKISQAEIALENREYSRAKMLFEDASALKPSEEYPKKRIESINAIINEVSTASLPELFKRCKGAVFYVIFPGKEGVSGGSGFFISEDGIAVSNYHVFKGKSKGTEIILTEDESEYAVAEVLEKNEDLDYIIFRVRKKNSFEKFPTVPLAKKVPVIGQRLFAIGNPNFLEKTLSDGIVSGFRGDKDEYIQITVPITHGSSGGPLFNMDGEVVGITTSGYNEGNLNFAVDIQKLRLYRFKGKSTGTW